jgi:glycosyltransferase involved in cell wall biosynthesis
MDKNHPLLSHQVDVATLLAKKFNQTLVLTAGEIPEVANGIKAISTNWVEGKTLRNVFRFYRNSLPVLWSSRKNSVIFSHMTDVQSGLLSPISKLLGVPHYLWYAHTHKSIYLKFASFFVDGIVTSTLGSCPISSTKVHAIGQAIDEKQFEFTFRQKNAALNRAVHVGRFDPSKRLDYIFSQINSLRLSFPELCITQVGSPSTPTARIEANRILQEWNSGLSEGWIMVQPSIRRQDLPNLLKEFDIFFHGYIGSLDKSLVEATMSGLPVVTVNPEYLEEFGSWSKGVETTLLAEYKAVLEMDAPAYEKEIERRYRICIDRHSRAKWLNQLANLLIYGTSTSSGSGT